MSGFPYTSRHAAKNLMSQEQKVKNSNNRLSCTVLRRPFPCTLKILTNVVTSSALCCMDETRRRDTEQHSAANTLKFFPKSLVIPTTAS